MNPISGTSGYPDEQPQSSSDHNASTHPKEKTTAVLELNLSLAPSLSVRSVVVIKKRWVNITDQHDHSAIVTSVVLTAVLLLVLGSVYAVQPVFINSFGVSIASIALVGVTAYYAVKTNRLVEEGKKNREIGWIEHRLCDFYQPALRSTDDDPRSTHSLFCGEWGSLAPLGEKLYLASDRLRREIFEFCDFDAESQISEAARKLRDLKKLIDSEIWEMTKRLDELTRS